MMNISRLKLCLATAFLSVLMTDALASHGDGRRPSREVKEWWVYEELTTRGSVVSAEIRYRLANQPAGQIKCCGTNRKVAGIYWGGINVNTGSSEGFRNVRFYKPARDPSAGRVSPNIQLNEGIAIYIEGGGYLVFDRGYSKTDLGWRNLGKATLLSDPSDIYQWQFRDESPRRSDHRKRDIGQKKQLALYNSAAKAYLVHGGPWKLRWERP